MPRCPISMIIPIHNNEKTLAACLDSILTQNARDYEIILVNNGSSEESVAICESYRAKDSRVKVIHMDHDTPASAANKGLEAATGKYVHFMGASDTLEENALEKVVPILLQNLDVIFLDSSLYQAPNFWDISHQNVLRRLNKEIPARLWDKLIKRDLLTGADIRFSKGIIWESVDFCITLYIHATTYGAVDFPYYIRNEGTSVLDTETVFNRIILTLSKWAGPAESTFEEYSTAIHAWMAAMYCDLLIPMYSQLSSGGRKLYGPGMKDFFWLLDTHKTREYQITKMLYSIFGPYITSLLFQYKNRYVPSSKAPRIIEIIHKQVNLIAAYCRSRISR